MEKITETLLVGFGGMFGAISRYLVGVYFQGSRFPYGTMIVNVIGSFLLGALVMMFRLEIVDIGFMSFAGIGFLGSYTTMSSFAVDTITLGENSLYLAVVNLVLMIIFVIAGALLGRFLILHFVDVSTS